jgi:hypothetical protein
MMDEIRTAGAKTDSNSEWFELKLFFKLSTITFDILWVFKDLSEI